jgi:hypothetical protein
MDRAPAQAASHAGEFFNGFTFGSQRHERARDLRIRGSLVQQRVK